jgi:poly(A) polymerase
MPAANTRVRLADQDWLAASETRAVVAALAGDGTIVRFVGGCVRDALAGRPVKDVDIATPDPPERVLARLAGAGIRAIPTGIDHGTITAVVGTSHFEVTTLRVDAENYGRRARVAFTADWEADAARRDLTMNAIYCDPDGTLYDPVGGAGDLAARRVRFVGDPLTRIDEDHLRILRFYRFVAHFGTVPPDPDGRAACRLRADSLGRLSGERVAAEVLRLLAAPDPAPTVSVMVADGVLAPILPEARDIGRLAGLVAIDRADSDPLRRLAALLRVDRAGAVAVARRLRLSNHDRDRLADACEDPPVDPALAPRDRRRRLYRDGAARFIDGVYLSWAAAGAVAATAWRRHLRAARAWVRPRFPLAGPDVLERGIPAGPEVGRLLAAVESWWVGRDFRPRREACLRRLDALLDVARATSRS